VSSKRQIKQVVRRLRRSERQPVVVRWHLALGAGISLAVGLFLLPRSQGGPVPIASPGAAEMARQRHAFACELCRSLTPLQRSTLDRLEPVVITTAGLTRTQRERAWRLAAVRGMQFPFDEVSRITVVFQKTPPGAGAPDAAQCVVRVEFASRGSAIAYSEVVNLSS